MFYLGKDIGFCDLEFGFFALKILITYILYKHYAAFQWIFEIPMASEAAAAKASAAGTYKRRCSPFLFVAHPA